LVNSDGDLIYDQQSIIQQAEEYYYNLFNAVSGDYWPQIQPRFIINSVGKKYLHDMITMEELKDAVFSIKDAKSPGPDGFSAKLFKLHLDELQHSLFSAISFVFQSQQLSNGLNHNFVTLIPKKDKLQNISDYRPISCANLLYKIISKIIYGRIKHFLPYLISENQSAFVPQRNIGENILLAHELVRDF